MCAILKKTVWCLFICAFTFSAFAEKAKINEKDFEKSLQQVTAVAVKNPNEQNVASLMELCLKHHDSEDGNFALAQVLVKGTANAEKFIINVKPQDKEKWLASRELFVAAASEVLYDKGEFFPKLSKVQVQRIKEFKDKFLKQLEDSVKK